MEKNLREEELAPKFMVDAMFGKLGRILRILGLNTQIASNHLSDPQIELLTLKEERLLITRDHAFYQKMTKYNHPVYFLKQQGLHNQLLALFRHLTLDPAILIRSTKHEPVSRCAKCNNPVEPVSKKIIQEALHARTAEKQEKFWSCTNEGCQQVYWIGSHWDKLIQLFSGVYADLIGTTTTTSNGSC